MTKKISTVKPCDQLYRCIIIAILPMVTAFSIFPPTWQKINNLIVKKYPEVNNISTDKLIQIFDDENIYLVDVRQAEEFAVSTIKGALNIETVSDVGVSKDRKIIVFCSVGYRSAEFAHQLQQIGYTKVYNLSGSIFEWANKGYPLFQGTSRTNFVHPFNNDWGRLLDKKIHSYTPIPNKEKIIETR